MLAYSFGLLSINQFLFITKNRIVQSKILFINYEAPNGKKLHNKLWNGGNGEGVVKLYHKNVLVDEILVKNLGCEYGVYGNK